METSMIESSSESEDNEEEDKSESSVLPEIPVNNIVDNTGSVSAPAAEPTSINGGRSHYVHSTDKKATTHRHHKRRNRHQTLRGYKK